MTDRTIVAHRGLSALYPENTILALDQAIRVGARAVEFDLQMTADKVPVLFHDTRLRRMTGRFGNLMRRRWAEIETYSAHHPGRFGNHYAGNTIDSFASAVAFLQQHPEVLACIEIKTESAERFGVKAFVGRVLEIAEPIMAHAQFLSFNSEVIEYLHSAGVRQTNWVLTQTTRITRRAAEQLSPSVLTCSLTRKPESFWEGPWDWMVYQTLDPAEALQLFEAGARYVESDDVELMAEALPDFFTKGFDERTL